jgi:hypothetical protein
MPWPVHPNGLLGAQGDNDSYQISRSLRFNSADSAYVSNTYASGTAATTWTISCWIKRSSLGSASCIFSDRLASNANVVTQLNFESNDTLRLVGTNTGGSVTLNLITTQVFRDTSAWFHLVIAADSTQATDSNRFKIYINGSQVTSFGTTTYPAQNSTFGVFSASEHNIGRRLLASTGTDAFFNGYISEFYAIDGQALTPSSFGETDAVTGRWKAKAYSGTYGTNGFYLKFADNSSTAALGTDSSGNGNTWTPNNFSVTAGAGNDSLVDSPTNYGSDAGVGGEVRGNYCTLNPLFGTVNTIQDGALVLTGTAAGNSQRVGTMAVSSGKWYYEVTLTTLPASQDPLAGFTEINNASAVSQYPGQSSSSYAIYQFSTNTYLRKVNAGSFTDTNTTVASQGDILGVALDLSSGKIWFSKNGTYVDSGNPATGANAQFTGLSGTFVPAVRGTGQVATTTITCNFGQRPFAYTAPTGFKALCTTNLPTPTIKKPSSYFDALAYTGTGASNSISSLGFSPDLVWIKNRGAATSHAIYDTTRGTQAQLSSNLTDAEVTSSTGLTAFGSNGFTIGTSTLVNTSGTQYVSWAWDEAPIAGMDIVSYTGTGAIRTVAHNLGVAPKMIIAKLTNSAGFQWPVYHSSLTSASSYIWLNSTNAQATDAAYWGTAPTSSVFSVGTNANVNNNTSPYIAYLFAEVEGFSKFGSYTGNASADGPFIYCGFRPKLIIGKRIDAVENWIIYDTSRDSFNVASAQLQPNTSIAETTANSLIDFNSNGFKFRSTNSFNGNSAGGTHIFAAFAESPFKYARAR